MSFSFGVRKADKVEAMHQVEAEMEKVVAGQPIHAADRPAVLAAVRAVVDQIVADPEKDITVSVSGWLSWNLVDGKEQFIGASMSVTAGQMSRDKPAS